MAVTNAFKMIVKVIEPKWYHIIDFAIIAGFQLKLAGVDWSSNDQLIRILVEMANVGFTEVDQNNPEMVRVKECYLGQAESV